MCIGRRALREEQRDALARARLVDVNVSPIPDYHRFPDVGQIFDQTHLTSPSTVTFVIVAAPPSP